MVKWITTGLNYTNAINSIMTPKTLLQHTLQWQVNIDYRQIVAHYVMQNHQLVSLCLPDGYVMIR
jgi:hypothetical protein